MKGIVSIGQKSLKKEMRSPKAGTVSKLSREE